jgi:DNA-binding CsgD family transcriptional regulator
MELSPGHPLSNPSALPLSLPRPGLTETLSVAFNRTVWELLRRSGKAATASEIGALCTAPLAETEAALHALMTAGLVKPALSPTTGRRDAFRIAHDRIVIAYDREDAQQSQTARELRERLASHGRSVLDTARAHGAMHDDHAIEVHRSIHLDQSEFEELRRRMQAVTDYLERLEWNHAGRPHACNYHVALEARPLRATVMPTAALHVVHHKPRAGAGQEEAAKTGPSGARTRVLSGREREIAELLAQGRSCPEIATSLEVSVNTVRTITKRLYGKLGISRRAELVHWLRGPTL